MNTNTSNNDTSVKSTFVIKYSPTDDSSFAGSPKFFGNDVAIVGHDFPEALEHLRNPDRCPDCMSKNINFEQPLMPVCKVCGYEGTLNKFRPAANILTHVILEEPVDPYSRQFFLFGNLGEAKQYFEILEAEMEADLELLFDSIEDKQSFWNGLFTPEGPKGEVLCLQ